MLYWPTKKLNKKKKKKKKKKKLVDTGTLWIFKENLKSLRKREGKKMREQRGKRKRERASNKTGISK